MSRMRKIVFLCLILVVIVITGISALVILLPDSDLVRVRAEKELSDITGQEVTIGSLKISPSLTGIIHMTAKEVSVKGVNNERLFSAEQVTFAPAIRPLLNKEISVDTITVSGFRVTLWRNKDGNLRLPEIIKDGTKSNSAGSKPNGGITITPTPQTASAKSTRPLNSEPPDATNEASSGDKVTLLIKKVNLVDGRLDWVDLRVWPGKQTLMSVEKVNGVIRQTSHKKYDVDLDSVIMSSGQKCGDLKMFGDISFLEGLNELVSLDIESHISNLTLDPFKAYIPPKASLLKEFEKGKIKSRISWKQGASAKIMVDSELEEVGERPAKLDLDGTINVSTVYWIVEKVSFTAETDFLPLRHISASIPENALIDPLLGVVKAGIKGDYFSKYKWHATGSLRIDGAILKPPYRSLAQKARIWSQFTVSPAKLDIESLEISGARPIAQIKGSVASPFSSASSFDLTGKISADDNWLKKFAISAPTDLSVKGPLPITGRVRGTKRELWLDLTANLNTAKITWASQFIKNPKSKGRVSLKGKLIPSKYTKSGKNYLNSVVRIGLANTDLRLSQKGKWLNSTEIQSTGKLALVRGALDFTDGVLKVRQAGEPGDLISISFDARDILSSDPQIKGALEALIDRRIPSCAGVELADSIKLGGSALLSGEFTRERTAWNWSAHADLKHLDVEIGSMLRKPVGVPGELTAKGRWGRDGLILDDSRLDLPGFPIRVRGVLLDKESRFSEVDIHTINADLKNVRAFMPPLAPIPLSGAIEAALSFHPDEQGHIKPSGIVRLLSVKYSPGPGAWRLIDTKGKVVIQGYSMNFPELTGMVQGNIEGPAKISGSLSDITSVKTINGKVSVSVGPGSLAVKSLVNIISKAKSFIDAITGNYPKGSKGKSDALRFKYFGGDFDVKYGKAASENFRLRGGDIKAAAIGSIDLSSQNLEAVTGLYTEVKGIGNIGEIPVVKKQLEKYSGILKSTGLAKELKRFGIKVPDSKEPQKEIPKTKPTPVTVFMRVYGPLASPDATPVLEQTLPPKITSKLKSMMK